jgi:hypothetical protein
MTKLRWPMTKQLSESLAALVKASTQHCHPERSAQRGVEGSLIFSQLAWCIAMRDPQRRKSERSFDSALRAALRMTVWEEDRLPRVLSSLGLRASLVIHRCLIALAFLCSVAFTHAANEVFVATDPQSGVKITLSSCFKYFPPVGCAPVSVKIENYSGGSGEWRFHFTSPVYSYGANRASFAVTLGAENNTTRSYDLLVPLAVIADTSAYMQQSLSVTVSGLGSRGGQTLFATQPTNPNTRTAFIGMSSALAARSWGPLEKQIESQHNSLAGTEVDTATLPSDWRGLSGLTAFWISIEEWTKLSTAQKLAVKDWVAQGGALYPCTQTTAVNALAEFGGGQGQDASAQEIRHGFGVVKTMTWNGRELEPAQLTGPIGAAMTRSLPGSLMDAYTAGWGEAQRIVGEPHLNAPLLITFMAVFGVVVGPVNLFLFAKGGRRARLFWTTPLLSVTASVLLLAVIILQDGFGGFGVRMVLVHLLPAERKAIVQQEQISRTGVVLDTRFTITDPVMLAPIKTSSASRVTSRDYAQSDSQSYAGDWFASRSVQAQFAEAVLPTRGEVQLVNAVDFKAGTAAEPVIVSSIGATLTELWFRDENKRVWSAQNVRVGEKVTLHRVPGDVYPLASLTDGSGPRLRTAIESLTPRTAHFFARTEDATGVAIPTLRSIRWDRQHVIYTGPVTSL